MKTISARIEADSVSPGGARITTFVLCYPRFIHSELLTHRAFSRNAASSRAIPIEKMIAEVQQNPAAPVRWGVNGKGMQDHGEADQETAAEAKRCWLQARMSAITWVEELNRLGIHKQIANRLMEPWAWMETLVTATDFANFFALRVHPAAQPEFQRVAYLMLKAYVASTPKRVEVGEWHMPFSDFMPEGITEEQRLKIASARSARLSYKTFDGEMSPEKDYGICDKLVGSVPGHWSPLEHPATPLGDSDGCSTGYTARQRCGPYRGWKSYRAFHPNENIRELDYAKHLADYESSMGVGRTQP
jgi:hypothetical protein